MKIYFAPMEGVTGYIFRNAHQKYFGGIDKYFMPFLSPNHTNSFSAREKKDMMPENNEGLFVVPQILTNKAEYFIQTANLLKGLGYDEVNLNVGCPSGTVTAKKRGAGFLSELEALDEFLDQIFHTLDMKISVKTRLGVEDPEEFGPLLDIYNDYPMEELIIHPRIREDFYKGKPRLGYFEKAVQESKNKLCYNGNLFTREQYEDWQKQFPGVDTIMLGRGAIANPALPLMIKDETPLDTNAFLHFHREIVDGYLAWNNGDKNVLFKMKELWFYFGQLYPDAKKELKKIKKSQTVKAYLEIAEELIGNHEAQFTVNF